MQCTCVHEDQLYIEINHALLYCACLHIVFCVVTNYYYYTDCALSMVYT